MPTPLDFRKLYFDISVDYEVDDKASKTCRTEHVSVRLNEYFLMNWLVGGTQKTHYDAVTAGSNADMWFRLHKDHVKCAAMGKGAPDDYQLALEWAVRSGHIPNPSQMTIQAYFDDNMGLDCSGFATNYLIANGKKPDTIATRQDTSAASYFQLKNAVNDPTGVKQGDLLVLMHGMGAKTDPGHVMVVESFDASCSVQHPYGSIRVVESTGAKNANPKLSDSVYAIEQIINKGDKVKGATAPCMILVTKRLGSSGFHVSVMRV